VFIAEEKLNIGLGADSATIRCDVTFREMNKSAKGRDRPLWILLPTWIPSDYEAKHMDALNKLSRTGFRDDMQRATREFEDLFGLRILINGTQTRPSYAFIEKSWSADSPLPREAFPKGFRCIVYSFDLPLKACRLGAKVSFFWRQPNRPDPKRDQRLFYLPVLPIGSSTVPELPNGYSRIALINCAEDVKAQLAWGGEDSGLAGGTFATLPLSHLQPLKVTFASTRRH
jgi:hypothetical protein